MATDRDRQSWRNDEILHSPTPVASIKTLHAARSLLRAVLLRSTKRLGTNHTQTVLGGCSRSLEALLASQHLVSRACAEPT